MYKSIIKPILFWFSPESAHKIVATLLKFPFAKSVITALFSFQDERLTTQLAGLTFKNPVGLAAGFDKDAELVDEMGSIGFGFIEIGTLTPVSQPGNPTPRLFRLPLDHALINRMGFNNQGVDAAIEKLKKIQSNDLIIGGNIGKNKWTPLENAINDYWICFSKLHPYVDYFVVNVSSPNTPNLRQLQDKKPLTEILKALSAQNSKEYRQKPIFLKIAPDLTDEQLSDIIDIVLETRIAGVVATNTTINRDYLTTDQSLVESLGAGGLSGKPLRDRSTEVIRYLSEKSGGKIPIIAAGGIHSASDAIEKLEAGASLVQIYTGFIYEGPSLVKQINKAILKYRKRKTISKI